MLRTHYFADLSSKLHGRKVSVAGWVQNQRSLGAVAFFKVRDRTGLTQVTLHKDKHSALFELASKLTPETVVAVTGTVNKSDKAQGGFEITPDKIDVLNEASVPLPLDVSGKIDSNLNTRLDWRSLDLRIPRNLAIFKIQAKLVEGMEEWLRNNNFTQVFTPCLMGAASEGGADVFTVNYFDKRAFLRQDPQLHRQLLLAAGFDKIFDLGPSWRAELSHTTRHLCEHRGCAVELAFIKDESDTMRVEEELVVAAMQKVKKECAAELETLSVKIEVPKTPFPELRFPKIYETLGEFGLKIPRGQDYGAEGEEILSKYVKEKYKSDFFFVNKFPFAVKPFYVMRVDEEPQWARSVDMIFRGLEISSGGQREHRYNKILAQIKEKKMEIDKLKWFTEVFRYGVPPHGGFNIGIERFTKQLLNLANIREAVLFTRDPERNLP